MKSLIVGMVLAVTLVSVGSAHASESFLFGVVKPGQAVGEASGSDPAGGKEHPKTSDKLIYGALGIKKDPFFSSFTRDPVASKEIAVEETWRDCAKNHVKCDEVTWFQYGCLATTVGAGFANFGASVKATLAEARQDALSQCRRSGGKDCAVIETFCAPKELN